MSIDSSFELRHTDTDARSCAASWSRCAPHLFTTREWPLGSRPTRATQSGRLAAALGVDADHFVRMHQVHGAAVVVRRAGDPPAVTPRPDADIVVSDDPSLALAIQTADCVPLLIADRVTGAVAAAHAGWRGLAGGCPGVTVAALAREFGSAPADLVAADRAVDLRRALRGGRGRARAIRRRRILSARSSARWFLRGARPEHWQFDGWRSRAGSAGIRRACAADHIHVAGCALRRYPDLFCSYRRDGKGAGRIAAAIRRRQRR